MNHLKIIKASRGQLFNCNANIYELQRLACSDSIIYL